MLPKDKSKIEAYKNILRLQKMGDNNPSKRPEVRKKISKTLTGRRPSEESIRKSAESRKGVKLSEEHRKKIGEAQKGRKCPHSKPPHYKGEKHPNWKGGITPKNDSIRASDEYKEWMKNIFERDNFTCSKYKNRGGDLVVHHIFNFAEHEDLRFEISNGITLSKKAHREFHNKYGYTNNTIEQMEEFLNGE